GGAELLVQDHVAAAGAERDLDRVGHLVDAGLEPPPPLFGELQDLRHGVPYLTMASTSRALRMSRSSPSTVISVPPYFEETTVSPSLTSTGMSSPVCSDRLPGPTARTSPCWGFSWAVSGMTSPEAVFSSDSPGLTTIRSSRG